MPIASTDRMELNYRIDGDNALPVLVLSNGLGTDLSMWDPQIPALSREFRVLRYDTRGHGASRPRRRHSRWRTWVGMCWLCSTA